MPTSAERIGGQDADMTATPPGSAEPFRLGYQPALDGLRAVSVLAVMLHHSGLLVGGWLGVDVFFALSGFLITTLLIEEHRRTGVIGLKRFYVRRALRLLPGLLALVIVFGTITIATPASVDLAAILLRLAAVLFYVANWAIMAGFGLYPFAHTWSLAIEEQFYALWPLALLVLLRYVRTRVVIVSIVGAGIAASIIWRGVLLHGGSLPGPYQGVDARADSLLIGCAVAMLVSWRMVPDSHAALITRRWAGLAAAMGLCLLFATARFPSAFRDHFASTLTALAGGLLIGDVLVPGSRLARFLEVRPLVGIGRISYGLYLWHFPILLGFGVLIGKRHGFHPVWLGLAWLVTFVVCIVSFRVIEQPALRFKSRFGGASGLGGQKSRLLPSGESPPFG